MGLAEQYQQQLLKLLPRGLAWPRNPQSLLVRLLLALAVEFSRVEVRATDLLREAYPLTTFELLPEWESELGLPEAFFTEPEGLQARREAVAEKLARRGGQSRQFYIDLATRLGFTITITEFRPFLVGQGRLGERLYGEHWRFAWQVNGPDTTYRYFRVGQSTSGERLRSWGNERLEGIINRLKPAHTFVLFAYGEL